MIIIVQNLTTENSVIEYECIFKQICLDYVYILVLSKIKLCGAILKYIIV